MKNECNPYQESQIVTLKLSCGLLMLHLISYQCINRTERLDNYTATLPNTILLELCRAVRQPTAAAATTVIVQTSQINYFRHFVELLAIFFAGISPSDCNIYT